MTAYAGGFLILDVGWKKRKISAISAVKSVYRRGAEGAEGF
jgi:hypothetical protein